MSLLLSNITNVISFPYAEENTYFRCLYVLAGAFTVLLYCKSTIIGNQPLNFLQDNILDAFLNIYHTNIPC